jgi:hypothetical protein
MRVVEGAEAMTGHATPQTRTVMEAGFTLREGIEEQFWRANNAAIATAAAQPGFIAVTGGPISNSSWLYFSGTWETPETMDEWYWSRRHKPMQDAAFSKWFAKMYIRKWRLPADGEELGERIFCQTRIQRSEPLGDVSLAELTRSLTAALSALGASAFETLTGEHEPQPFQLVGPVEELPQTAPAGYLLLTHWRSADAVKAYLHSSAYGVLGDLGEVSSELFVPIAEQDGTRPGLRADGFQRDWTYQTGPWKSLRSPLTTRQDSPEHGRAG